MCHTENGSAKSVMGRHVLSIHECVESGGIRTEKWKRKYNTADSETKALSVEVLRKHVMRRTSVGVACKGVTA